MTIGGAKAIGLRVHSCLALLGRLKFGRLLVRRLIPVVKCPRCGKENSTPTREWTGGKSSKGGMKVQRFVCSSCATSYVAWHDRTGELRVMTKKQ